MVCYMRLRDGRNCNSNHVIITNDVSCEQFIFLVLRLAKFPPNLQDEKLINSEVIFIYLYNLLNVTLYILYLCCYLKK